MSGSARQRLLIFPCNGNGREAVDALGDAHELVGFIDDAADKHGTGPYGVAVYGRAALDEFADARVLAVPGAPSSYMHRRAIVEGLGVAASRFATIVHPSAHISRHATLGHNVLIMAGVVITSNTVIGNHVCILPNSVVHHDTTVGDWTLIGSGVTIAGGCTIGENCYIGSAASIINEVSVGALALIGMGATVVESVPPGATVVGNPARRIATLV